MMYKLIHIHTDQKFVNDTTRYIDERLSNEILFLGNFSTELELKLDKVNLKYSIMPKTEESITEIILLLGEYDIIVINKLCNFSASLLKSFPNHYRVFLRLFGSELYGKQVNRFISKRTRLAIYPINLNTPYLRILKNLFIRCGLMSHLRQSGQKKRYRKIDRILLFNEYEYRQLGEYFHLPKALQVPLSRNNDKVDINTKKIDRIVIGNSKHIWNNHLDILSQLKNVKNIDNYQLFLFFNYGPANNYTAEVEKLASSFKNITLQEEFVNLTTFGIIYSEASAIVVNSFRQHALGNIFTAIFKGCKIYLNKRSSTYLWLKDSGFIISEISTLAEDVLNDRVKLSQSEMAHNIAAYFELRRQYTYTDFVNRIIKFIEE